MVLALECFGAAAAPCAGAGALAAGRARTLVPARWSRGGRRWTCTPICSMTISILWRIGSHKVCPKCVHADPRASRRNLRRGVYRAYASKSVEPPVRIELLNRSWSRRRTADELQNHVLCNSLRFPPFVPECAQNAPTRAPWSGSAVRTPLHRGSKPLCVERCMVHTDKCAGLYTLHRSRGVESK
jgi:hypothetical protein